MLKYLMMYEDRELEIIRGEAQYVWDKHGNKYLDMHTGHGVAFLGHRNPHIVKSLIEQMERIMTLSTSFRTSIRDEMLEALSKIVPSDYEYVYLLNSGSEAIEFSIKICRKASKREKIVYFTGSFHGRTLGALSITSSNRKYREGFEPLLPGTCQARFNDPHDVDKVIDNNTSCVVLELIQGEGGVNVALNEFVKHVVERASETGAYVVIDEVQTGFGRTGTVWLFEQYGVKPDILVAGKAIGGGFPVSAVFTRSDIANKLEEGSHGTTYGGNPLACAAVKASVDVLLQDNVPSKARESGELFMYVLSKRIGGNRLVKDIRGKGLMIGVDLRVPPTGVIKCLQRNGLLALKAGVSVVRFLPPYMITTDDIYYAVNLLEKCVDQELSRRDVARSIENI
ncbi:MAG: aspartate aminotransferase family protein [Desulfurococcaceae archaeon]